MSIDRPMPEAIPRHKAYTYIFLIFFTVLLLYFYSYPLDAKSLTNIRPVSNIFKSIYGDKVNESDTYDYYSLSEDTNSKDSLLLQKLFPNRSRITTNTLKSFKNETLLPAEEFSKTADDIGGELSSTTSVAVPNEWNTSSTTTSKLITTDAAELKLTTNEVQNELAQNLNEKDVTKAGNDEDSGTTYGTEIEETVNNKVSITTTSYPENSKTTLNKTLELVNSSLPLARNTTMGVSEVENGFLVFSKNCRIPDLDPMHPSIRHLVSKTPPLDCSKDYEPLTWTEGNVLFLNRMAITMRTSGENSTCCYRNVTRERDGLTDNGVGFGKECIEISGKSSIKYEFIKVECQYENGTEFYKEFHSFIHDKPEVEKRCKKLSENSSMYSVLIIGVDAVSRMNMHRQLNATASYFLNEMGATEMFGFNKVGDNTFPNLIPLLMGYDERELSSVCWKSQDLPLDRCNFKWKQFSAKGYRTFYAEDVPHISSFNYVKDGFLHQPTDYYFRHFILAYEDALGRDKPLNCHLCVGSVSETEAVLSWTEKFASNFADRPYFAFSWINSLTHDFLNMGSSGDYMYERFFRSLHRTGALNKTIVILMGDHGMRWGEIRKTYIGRLEERLPMLMVALPEDFKQEHPEFAKTLQQNAHRLITPFDLHATLDHILNLRSNWSLVNSDDAGQELVENFTSRSYSLFQHVPEDRSCDDAFVDEHWCTCETSLEADIASNHVKKVADFLVSRVNNLLKPESVKCAVLELSFISDARLWQPPSEHEGHSAEDNIYTVVIHAKPGGAVLEGTVKISGQKENKELLGSISRLNLYGNQSACIDNAILRKYCYCL